MGKVYEIFISHGMICMADGLFEYSALLPLVGEHLESGKGTAPSANWILK